MKEYNSLKGMLLFEIRSWVGRNVYRNRSQISINNDSVLLDLGVGLNFTENWVHADFYSSLNPITRIFGKKDNVSRQPEVQLDLRYPLNCPSNSVDGVYTSHTIEHLLPHEAVNLLKEIFRVLKADRWLRIVVPDVRIVVDYYVGKNNRFEFSTGCEAIMHITQNWGHRSSWDEEFLSRILASVGFVNIKKVEYGIEGHDSRLIKESESRKFESLVMEAQKPNI